MAGISSLSELGVSSVEYAVGFGLGVALGRALGPLAVTLEQEAFAADPSKALDPETAARIVAQAIEAAGWGRDEAAASGINGGKFDLLHELEIRAPAIGELLDMARRRTVGDPDFAHGLRKAQIDPRYDAAIRQLELRALDGAELANAIHRGNIADAGLLLVAAPRSPGRIPQYDPIPVDALEQARWHGLNKDQLGVLVANAGLPLALHEMLGLLNRGLVTVDDVKRAIAHSNIRNEYMDAAIDLRRRLLTPHEYAELRIRGRIDDGELHAGAALSGMEAGDAELLYHMLGRAGTPHAVTTGLARGAKYPGSYADVPEPWRTAIERSNTIEEMASIAYSNRYSYPSAFVVRSLVAGGELTPADAEAIFLETGWKPSLAAKVAKALGGTGGGQSKALTAAELADEYEGGFVTETEYRAALGDLGYAGHELDLVVHLGDARRAKRYREKVVDAIAAAYTSFRLSDSDALAELAVVNVTGQPAAALLELWQLQRKDTIRSLTQAQIKKALKAGIMDRATALEELEWQGVEPADAATILDE